jgi:hypothetical protein
VPLESPASNIMFLSWHLKIGEVNAIPFSQQG